MRTTRALAVASALLAVLLLAPATASAHALLVDTAPRGGATLDAQPRQVVLHFSETVEGNFGALRVFDSKARRIDDGRTTHPQGSGSRLAVGLRPGLPDGTYVATYRVDLRRQPSGLGRPRLLRRQARRGGRADRRRADRRQPGGARHAGRLRRSLAA